MYWADRAAYKFQAGRVMFGLFVASVMGIVALVLRYYEFAALEFAWNDNAYGSLIWGLLVLQTLYLILEIAEAAILVLWIPLYGLDKKLGADVTLATGYWVWTASTAVVVYAVVYWAPRVMSS
jgi:heme/copper-type cytochrome/quinol oxidase subunit 3